MWARSGGGGLIQGHIPYQDKKGEGESGSHRSDFAVRTLNRVTQ